MSGTAVSAIPHGTSAEYVSGSFRLLIKKNISHTSYFLIFHINSLSPFLTSEQIVKRMMSLFLTASMRILRISERPLGDRYSSSVRRENCLVRNRIPLHPSTNLNCILYRNYTSSTSHQTKEKNRTKKP